MNRQRVVLFGPSLDALSGDDSDTFLPAIGLLREVRSLQSR